MILLIGGWVEASARFADDQFSAHQGQSLGWLAVHQVYQLAHCFTPDLLNWGPDRCQRGREVPGRGDIVKTDNGNILWDAAPCLFKGMHCANGCVVIPGKDRVEVESIR